VVEGLVDGGVKGLADAAVDRVADHKCAGFLGDFGGAIGAAVIDHQEPDRRDAVEPRRQ
jgi:hypothetical protein